MSFTRAAKLHGGGDSKDDKEIAAWESDSTNHIGQRHQQLKKLTAEFKQKMGKPEKERSPWGFSHNQIEPIG